MQFKIVHRLHWSKARLDKNIDPNCDRCGTTPATISQLLAPLKINIFLEIYIEILF